MPADEVSRKQARRLLTSVVFIAFLIGLLLAVGFGLVLHLGFGVGYEQMFQSIFYAFRR